MGFLQEFHKVSSAGNDGVGVEFRVGAVVVRFDLFHVDRVGNARHLVNVAAVVEDGGGVGDAAGVGFEVDRVDLIKAQECHKETNVGFRKGITGNVPLLLQNRIDAVKGFGQFGNGLVVGGLGGGKAAPVDTVVDGGVDPVVDRVNGLLHLGGVQVHVGVGGQIVKLRVEHADNLGRFVADNRVEFLVPQNRDRVLAVRVLGSFV